MYMQRTASGNAGDGLYTAIEYMRGAEGIGLGTTIKYLRRTTSGAAGNGLYTTIKYLRGASGIGMGTTIKQLRRTTSGATGTAWRNDEVHATHNERRREQWHEHHHY